jgi:flagellar assembly protein FliH
MAKAVFTKEEADKVAVAFSPRKFPSVITPSAIDFVKFQSQQESPSFRIDRNVAQQTGVAELERISLEEKVEREALARLKDVQEQAYQQAYQLGLDEGRELAFQEHQAQLNEKIDDLDQLLTSIVSLKKELVNFNESHIVRLVTYVGKRIAMTEIHEKPETILSVIRQAVENAQNEEHVTIRVSPSDLEFIESVKDKLGKEMEFLQKAKIESVETISNGGCIIATNYGDIDASLEQRVDKVWLTLSEKLPRVKNEIGE